MSLVKKIKDKKVNFEFNKEYIKVVTSKIANNDAQFITNSFSEMHPADAADIIEHLSQNDSRKQTKSLKSISEMHKSFHVSRNLDPSRGPNLSFRPKAGPKDSGET